MTVRLSQDAQTKLLHVAFNSGLPFLAAVVPMPANILQVAMNGGTIEADEAAVIERWVTERVSTSLPVSKVRIEPISSK